jgi:telomere length regulation protein
MDDLIVSISSTKSAKREALITEVADHDETRNSASISSPQAIISVLKSEPNISDFRAVIGFLRSTKDGTFNAFNFWVPSAPSAEIIHLLIHQSIPTFWTLLQTDSSLQGLKIAVINCFKSVHAIGALVAALRNAIRTFNVNDRAGASSGSSAEISILIDLLENVLFDDALADQIWKDLLSLSSSEAKRLTLWKEFVSLVATGKVISSVAEAQSLLRGSNENMSDSWLSVGNQYSQWLAKNISLMMTNSGSADSLKTTAAAQMLGKALSLGYSGSISKDSGGNYVLTTYRYNCRNDSSNSNSTRFPSRLSPETSGKGSPRVRKTTTPWIDSFGTFSKLRCFSSCRL